MIFLHNLVYKRFIYLIIICVFCNTKIFAQNSGGLSRTLDSLNNLLISTKEDTNKVNILNELAWKQKNTDTTQSILNVKKSIKLSEKINYTKGLAKAYKVLGIINENNNNYSKALENYFKSLQYNLAISDLKNAAYSYNNIGVVYYMMANYSKAVENYFSSLKLMEQIKEDKGEAMIYGNLGTVYKAESNYTQALSYQEKSLKIRTRINDKTGIATSLTNIANIYYDQEKYEEALNNFLKSLSILKELDKQQSIATTMVNIGLVYQHKKDYTQALDYENKALEIYKEQEDDEGVATVYYSIAEIYKNSGDYTKAIEHTKKSLEISYAIEALEDIKEGNRLLYELYTKTGDEKKAFYHYKNYVALKDSIFNSNKIKEQAEQELSYQFEKKQHIIELEQEKKNELQKAEVQRQKIIRNIILIFLAIVLVLAYFIFKESLIRKKTNIQLNEQKKLIEEKNKEITDSIHYAKRIQRALLTSDNYIKNLIKNYFIIYEPKDIVSGDFYWIHKAQFENENKFENLKTERNESHFQINTFSNYQILIATADCTGHGVPGAFMSMLGVNFLNEIVLEKKVSEPGKILNQLRSEIIAALNAENTEGEQIKDGMDMSFCSIDLETLTLKYACANHSVFVLRNKEIIELFGNKFPVGIYGSEQKDFETFEFNLQKDDLLYTFTDGIADQFGGEKGKKLKKKNLKELIINNSQLTLPEQKQTLSNYLKNWQGNYEQVDDKLMIAVKI